MRTSNRLAVFATVVVLVLAPAVVGVGSAAGPSDGVEPAGAQEETVTLTVAVRTPGGDPVGSATITASWENGSTTATTASNGRAFVDVPAGATVEVAVDHPEYVRNNPVVVEDAREETVTVTVRERGSLTVRVEDERGNAVGDALVVLREDGDVVVSGRTNANGGFTSGDVEQRDYSLTVVKRGYYRVNRDVTVDDSARETVTLEQGSVTVSFVVTDDRFDPPEPVSNAQLRLETAGTFTTLRNGEATAQVPVNADLELEVTKEGYETVTRTVEVGESPMTVRLNISRTPRLNVTAVNRRVLVGERTVVSVADAYGDPVADARILVDGEEVGTTGGDGTVTIRFESAGNHTVVAETEDLTSEGLTIRAVSARTETATPTESPTPTATASPTTTATEEPDTGVSFPGFTPATALLALLALGALFTRRTGRGGE
ncbi:carboxypeptidase-like regulatory domain-containing protein [Halobaculum sp. EA56]|uniref:carboxypeptidase-like regulatory domain-containing protein n=1 Tax=Halobaculum sp. EA56 TaxID=3421648 RepID=UPI003EBB87B2